MVLVKPWGIWSYDEDGYVGEPFESYADADAAYELLVASGATPAGEGGTTGLTIVPVCDIHPLEAQPMNGCLPCGAN
jgi:hypothetical protein